MEEQPQAPLHVGSHPAGKQLGRERPGDPGRLPKLNVNQQYALAVKKADDSLGCQRQSITRGLREVYSALVRPPVEYWIQFWAPQHKRDRDILENIQKRPREVIKGPDHLGSIF